MGTSQPRLCCCNYKVGFWHLTFEYSSGFECWLVWYSHCCFDNKKLYHFCIDCLTDFMTGSKTHLELTENKTWINEIITHTCTPHGYVCTHLLILSLDINLWPIQIRSLNMMQKINSENGC